MRKREGEKVLLIAETNWLESIALVQDPVASYLLDLADTKEIEIAVPEYSFYEADGSLNRKLIKRVEKIDDALSLLGQISQSGHSADLCKRGREILIFSGAVSAANVSEDLTGSVAYAHFR